MEYIERKIRRKREAEGQREGEEERKEKKREKKESKRERCPAYSQRGFTNLSFDEVKVSPGIRCTGCSCTKVFINE